MDNKLYNVFYRIILFLLFQYVFPMVFLTYLNAKVVWSVRKSSPFPVVIDLRRPSSSQKRSLKASSGVSETVSPTGKDSKSSSFSFSVVRRQQHRQQSGRVITVVVVVVVSLCIVCHVVAMVSQVVWSVQVANYVSGKALAFDLFRRHISIVSNLLTTVNSAANFIVYCVLSSNFRLVLARCCTCRRSFGGGGKGCCCCRVGRGRDESSCGTKNRSTVTQPQSFQLIPFGHWSSDR